MFVLRKHETDLTIILGFISHPKFVEKSPWVHFAVKGTILRIKETEINFHNRSSNFQQRNFFERL